MDLTSWFSKLKSEPKKETQEEKSHWIKCPKCESLMFFQEVEKLNFVCPKCSHHMRITAIQRIKLLADEGSFTEFDQNLLPTDPLNFVDRKSYKKRLEEALKKLVELLA